MEPTEEMIEEAIRHWEPRYGRKLTREDACEIIRNMTAYLRILMEWDRRERAKAAEAGGQPDPSFPAGPS